LPETVEPAGPVADTARFLGEVLGREKKCQNAIGVTGKLFSVQYVRAGKAFLIRSATAPNAMVLVKYAPRMASTGSGDRLTGG
jgi:hypothetical protein